MLGIYMKVLKFLKNVYSNGLENIYVNYIQPIHIFAFCCSLTTINENQNKPQRFGGDLKERENLSKKKRTVRTSSDKFGENCRFLLKLTQCFSILSKERILYFNSLPHGLCHSVCNPPKEPYYKVLFRVNILS